MKNKIDEIARKDARDLTREDKQLIEQLSKEMGIEFKPRPRCANCYADQALILWMVITSKNQEDDARSYILKDGVDVIFMGMRICEDTLTDELAEEILSKGFARYFFKKCK